MVIWLDMDSLVGVTNTSFYWASANALLIGGGILLSACEPPEFRCGSRSSATDTIQACSGEQVCVCAQSACAERSAECPSNWVYIVPLSPPEISGTCVDAAHLDWVVNSQNHGLSCGTAGASSQDSGEGGP